MQGRVEPRQLGTGGPGPQGHSEGPLGGSPRRQETLQPPWAFGSQAPQPLSASPLIPLAPRLDSLGPQGFGSDEKKGKCCAVIVIWGMRV